MMTLTDSPLKRSRHIHGTMDPYLLMIKSERTSKREKQRLIKKQIFNKSTNSNRKLLLSLKRHIRQVITEDIWRIVRRIVIETNLKTVGINILRSPPQRDI